MDWFTRGTAARGRTSIIGSSRLLKGPPYPLAPFIPSVSSFFYFILCSSCFPRSSVLLLLSFISLLLFLLLSFLLAPFILPVSSFLFNFTLCSSCFSRSSVPLLLSFIPYHISILLFSTFSLPSFLLFPPFLLYFMFLLLFPTFSSSSLISLSFHLFLLPSISSVFPPSFYFFL